MQKERTDQELWDELASGPAKTARETRFLVALGEDAEALGEVLRLRPGGAVQVYNIQLRGRVADNQDVLMLVKAVGEGGPVIAFHSGRTFTSTLLTWPSRLRSGKVVWKPDEYPPSNYDQIEAYINRELEHFAATVGGRSQGADSSDK